MTRALARRTLALWLAAGLTAALAAGGPGSKKRAAPPEVEPVVVGDLRIEPLLHGKARGRGQNGGDLVAVDAVSGAERWTLRVYEIRYDARMEADKQDVHITSLRVAPDGRTLLVADERGRRWRVDTLTRAVSQDVP